MINKTIKIGTATLRYCDSGRVKRLHLNLGRTKTGKKIETYTLYNSISDEDKTVPYFEVWQDKKGEKTVGLEIMWG